MAWTTPRTWVAGEEVTEALLNTHVRDNLAAIGDAWTTYTPSWTAASVNPSIGNGTLQGRYVKAGRLVLVEIQMLAGSTTTFGTGGYTFTLPFSARSSSNKQALYGSLFDSSLGTAVTSIWPIAGILGLASSTSLDLAGLPTGAGNSYRVVNSSNHFTLATGDRIDIGGVYEAAA